MNSQDFASYAWLLEGLTVSIPGWLDFHQGRLRFATPEEVVFDVERADVAAITFPWYYFGGGMKLRAGGKPYRLSFVKPNGAEYAVARGMTALGNPVPALLVVAEKGHAIREGREAGLHWRRLLDETAR